MNVVFWVYSWTILLLIGFALTVDVWNLSNLRYVGLILDC